MYAKLSHSTLFTLDSVCPGYLSFLWKSHRHPVLYFRVLHSSDQAKSSLGPQTEEKAQSVTSASGELRIPTSLTLTAEYDTKDTCFTAFFKSNGDILVGCADGLKVVSKETKQLVKSGFPFRDIFGAQERDGKVYVLRYREAEEKDEENFAYSRGSANFVDICSLDLQYERRLSTFYSIYRPKLVLAERFYGVSVDDETTTFYDVENEKKFTLPVFGQYPYLLPGGYLLDSCDDNLTKYKIEGSEVTEIWRCEDIPFVVSVCLDSNGLIFAGADYKRQIQVVSPTGEKLVMLPHDKLPSTIMQMCIVGDELLVPGWNKNKLLVFKINY